MKNIISNLKSQKMSSTFLALLFCGGFSVAAPIIGSVSTATGGTGRGAIEPVDGVLLNPSSVAQLKSKFFSFNYSKDQLGLTISDNGKDALFPAALAFVRSEKENFKTQDMALVIAYRVAPRLSLGTTISMVEYVQDLKGLEQKNRQTVGDIGASILINKEISVGVVANKIFSSSCELDSALQKQKSYGAGMNFTYQNFVRFRFDVESAPENKTNKLIYMGGVETYMNDWVVARFGYQNNNVLAKNYMTAGAGFAGPQFGIHYAYLTNVSDRNEDRHSVDLGIPF